MEVVKSLGGAVLINRQNGHATVLVLSFVVLISAILVVYSLWVRWEAFSTLNFIDRIQTHSDVLEGVYIGFDLLLEDHDPFVDSLKDNWVLGFCDHQIVVEIFDEGSKLGLNWLDHTWWKHILPNDTLMSEETYNSITKNEGLIGSVAQFINDLDNKSSDILKVKQDLFTVHSSININSLSKDSLVKLWKSLGYGELAAKSITDIILDKQYEGIQSLSELLNISLITNEVFEKVSPWLSLSGPININTVPIEILEVILQVVELDKHLSHQIASARLRFPIRNKAELAILVNLKGEELDRLCDWISYNSTYFRVVSNHLQDNLQIEAIVRRTWDPTDNLWTLETLQWIERDTFVEKKE